MYCNEELPGWLTRDWDPAKYAYGRQLDNGEPCLEDSPAKLARYRAMYEKLLRECVGAEKKNATIGRSLLVENLYIAADDPLCTDSIVKKIFDESLRARGWRNKKEDFDVAQASNNRSEEDSGDESDDEVYLYDLITELEDGVFNEEQLAVVKQGYSGLCEELDHLEGEFWKVEPKSDPE